MSNSPRLGVQLVPEGAMDLDQPFNNLARQLDQVLNVRVLSATTAAQPGSPASGALYILPASPSGASWAGKAAGTLALFDSGTWYFTTPAGFIVAHVVDTGAVLAWSGAAWTNLETLFGAKGADVAAAATVTLASATGDYIHVTGTGGPITSFGSAKAGLARTLVHDAVHTLTNSANIITLTGANVITAAGDVSFWRSEGAGVWRMAHYVRANGLGLGAAADAAVVHLAGTETISGAKTFTSMVTAKGDGGAATTPQANTVVHVVGADAAAARVNIDTFGSFAVYQARYANGTKAAPTAPSLSNTMMGVAAAGWDGSSAYTTSRANFNFYAAENWALGQGTFWQLSLTPIGGTSLTTTLIARTDEFTPGTDNVVTLGSAPRGWKELFCDNGTINTSDARLKTAVRPFTEAEIAAALELSEEVGFFQFLRSVELKGSGAREHCGTTVQRAIEILISHGLDPFNYGFICHDEWTEQPEVWQHYAEQPEVVDEKTGELLAPAMPAHDELVTPFMAAGDRYSFRPDQLDRFIVRGVREEQKRLAARIATLEAR